MTTALRFAQLLSLDGRVALVTGAGGGIGSAIVELLRDAGAAVIGVDLAGHEAARANWSHGHDVSSPDEVAELVARVRELPGRLDLLVHACGITRDARITKLSMEDWSRVLEVNLGSAFLVLQGFAELLEASEHASVVLISSINGERGKFGQANYAASKAGLNALARTAAREFGRAGVRVNAVAPGLIETPMTELLPEKIRTRALDETVLGRVGLPEDVAATTLFLCSDAARHITGQVIRVDGGQLIA